jgi:hypothetical protein
MTIAMLIANTLQAARWASDQSDQSDRRDQPDRAWAVR